MEENRSPWLHQLNRMRPLTKLEKNIDTEVAIVGGGIAGISTAYFTLKNTNRKVVLLEGSKIAHGATGHNAGQLVSYFERQLSDLVKEFGLELAAEGQKAVKSAWQLIDEIFAETKLKTPLHKFTGYAGCVDMEEVLVHLDNNRCYRDAQMNDEKFLVAEEWERRSEIPRIYDGLYSVVPHSEILALLETTDKSYIGTVVAEKGCMNSAHFTEELAGYLLSKYPDRFEIYEDTHVTNVRLGKNKAMLEASNNRGVRADKVVLCTNGFEKFDISNEAGENINPEFHHNVMGVVGYMAAYLDKDRRDPSALSYLPHRSSTGNSAFDSDPYFYLTRRPFEIENSDHDLVSVAGPETRMDDTNNYTPGHPYPEEAQKVLDEFLHKTYKSAPKDEIKYHYRWHGLMGYTPNGIRRIGPEPKNPVLLYNLGCNGVGILPSIYGGQRISWILQGQKLPRSIFDPVG